MVDLLGEKFTFFNSLGTNKISRSLKLSVYINGFINVFFLFILMFFPVFILINFPEPFELCFYFKIREVIKFYNLGDKTFETDFN